MPDALIVQIADAMVDALNDASLSQSFTATRKNRPRFALADLADLTVTVAPRRMTTELSARDLTVTGDYLVDVGILKRFDDTGQAPDNDDTDPYLYLVEEIRNTLFGQRLAAGLGVVIGATTGDDLFDVEDLDTQQLFTAALTFTIREV